ncbi:MAG: arginine--tRNA ligase [candidate division WOR-3 bacterium]|nr:MAG: arginine--tRNA ligase [candidate division WOR-3 bacterium]
MIRQELKDILKNMFPDEEIVIDYVPKEKEGDYSTNIAFKIASREGKDPKKIAEHIVAKIKSPIIKHITVHKPAFINFTIDENYLLKQLTQKSEIDIGRGESILIEYVSANPTGPINVVSARAAAVGDSLVRILNQTGFKAHAEYYINDGGKQIELLAESVRQRMIELQGGTAHLPEDGYHGEYIIDVAREALKRIILDTENIKTYAVNYFVENHKKMLSDFGVVFDYWTHESDIYKKKYVDKILKILKDKKLTYMKDGALFFKTTEFDDDRDRVIITSDKHYTYLLPDIAYHFDKIERNYNKLINIWGPDHHGYMKALYGGIEALGHPTDILKILIVQEVKLKKGGKFVAMSKRAGTFTTLDELLEKIPTDVARFFFLMRSSSQHLDFDLDLALKQSDENPVYYVQYAHARIKSIIKFAEEKGIMVTSDIDLTHIKEKEELALVKNVLKFPEMLEDAVRHLEPYFVTYYLIDLAHDFHYFYQKHRVVSDDRELTQARLFLIQKTAEIIKNGLGLLGVSCPEHM